MTQKPGCEFQLHHQLLKFPNTFQPLPSPVEGREQVLINTSLSSWDRKKMYPLRWSVSVSSLFNCDLPEVRGLISVISVPWKPPNHAQPRLALRPISCAIFLNKGSATAPKWWCLSWRFLQILEFLPCTLEVYENCLYANIDGRLHRGKIFCSIVTFAVIWVFELHLAGAIARNTQRIGEASWGPFRGTYSLPERLEEREQWFHLIHLPVACCNIAVRAQPHGHVNHGKLSLLPLWPSRGLEMYLFLALMTVSGT